MGWIIGVDVGGTFTDFHAFDSEGGAAHLYKAPSTPDDPARAILDGLAHMIAGFGIGGGEIDRLAHGTTVATNALIQRRGAAVAVVTTEGFRDLLEIGRQIRPKMFDLKADHPPPLAPRHLRFEARERIGGKGQVICPLEEAAVAAAIAQIRAAGVEACAVCFLFAFLNPEHERRMGAALRRALPDMPVSLSSEVQPEFREYERFSTTTLNAYLQPLIGRYMTSLGRSLRRLAPNARLGINQSSGGLMSIDRAGRMPIRTALSGPAAGAVGAMHTARLAGRAKVITLDMGGTSADVALIDDYRAGISFNRDVAGFPVRLPTIDINTVGAGGGSIAWFDRDGLLKVGPASAGAAPGPACYGQGGTEATVSDANLVLGRLSDRLLGGAMALDRGRAEAALRPLAGRLGFSLARTAYGIIAITVANMVRAIRTISVERGHDPRDFALMAFGGAGALHGGDVARALEMRAIIVPPAPGILCAQGLVVSDLKEDFVAGIRLRLEADGMARLETVADGLMARAADWFAAEAIPAPARRLRLDLDMRYVRQNFELTIPAAEPATADGRAGLRLPAPEILQARFHEAHERTYGHATREDPIEVMNVRVTALGLTGAPPPSAPAAAAGPAQAAGTRPIWFTAAGPTETPVHDRAKLAPGHAIAGPAVIEQLDATTLLHPGDTARVDPALNLIIEVDP